MKINRLLIFVLSICFNIIFASLVMAEGFETLGQLIKDKRVMIAAKELTIHDNELRTLLGQKMKSMPGTDGEDTLKPLNKLHVKVYCLGGETTTNEILYGKYGYGGDSGAYYLDIKTKKKLPKGVCLFVNGTINNNQAIEGSSLC